MDVRAHDGATVLATRTLPWPAPDSRSFSSIHSNPPWGATDLPELVFHRVGQGKVICSASLIEEVETLQESFVRLLRQLNDRFTFEVTTHPAVEATLFHQPDRSRYVFSLVNFQRDLPNVPLDEIPVTLRIPGRIRRIEVLPACRRLGFRESASGLSFVIPRLETLVQAAISTTQRGRVSREHLTLCFLKSTNRFLSVHLNFTLIWLRAVAFDRRFSELVETVGCVVAATMLATFVVEMRSLGWQNHARGLAVRNHQRLDVQSLHGLETTGEHRLLVAKSRRWLGGLQRAQSRPTQPRDDPRAQTHYASPWCVASANWYNGSLNSSVNFPDLIEPITLGDRKIAPSGRKLSPSLLAHQTCAPRNLRSHSLHERLLAADLLRLHYVSKKQKLVRDAGDLMKLKAAPDLAWLSEVEQAKPPENPSRRIWIKSGCVQAERSTIPHPHRHSFCEISLQFSGTGVLSAGRESVERKAGDLLLMGAQVPHWFEIKSHPVEYVTFYFFPTALVNWVAPEVSILLLQRVTAVHPLKQRNVHLPEPLLHEFTQVFRSALTEFEAQRFGWELHLQSTLVRVLLRLVRWEREERRLLASTARPVDWERLDRVLQHLREQHAEPVYGRELARLAGMSESSFNGMFRDVLGLSWVKYLQGLRIQKALSLLAHPGQTIASVAFASGFESLSHFNSTFRLLMGMSPKELLGKQVV